MVDSFTIDVLAAAGSITDFSFGLGNYRIASTDLSIEVECLPGYSGERCTASGSDLEPCNGDSCSEGEVSTPSADGPRDFSRANTSAVTGTTTTTTTTTATTATATLADTANSDVGAVDHDNTTSGSVGAGRVAGAVVGSVAFVAIIVAVVAAATIVLVARRRRTKKGHIQASKKSAQVV